MSRHRDDPHATALYAEHVALDLGQVPEDTAPDEWATPEGQTGTTMSTTSVSDGEPLDPPGISVHVYSGMAFYDRQEDRVVTFDVARWFAFKENPDLDYSTPRDPVVVEFEEEEFPYDDEEGPNLSLSGNEFARRLASGRYQNVTGEVEEDVEA